MNASFVKNLHQFSFCLIFEKLKKGVEKDGSRRCTPWPGRPDSDANPVRAPTQTDKGIDNRAR
jgi:hypothetical protein